MTSEDMATTHAAAFTGSRSWGAAEFASLLAGRHCFVTGDARCFALVRTTADEAELLTMATHPDHQRQGLARACMEIWHARAVKRGANRVFLEVADDNLAATALYVSCGYTVQGRRRGYYRRAGELPVDAVMMARALP